MKYDDMTLLGLTTRSYTGSMHTMNGNSSTGTGSTITDCCIDTIVPRLFHHMKSYTTNNRGRCRSIPILLRIVRIIQVLLFAFIIITLIRMNVLYQSSYLPQQQQQIYQYYIIGKVVHDAISSPSSSLQSSSSSLSCLVHEPLYIPYIVDNTRRRNQAKEISSSLSSRDSGSSGSSNTTTIDTSPYLIQDTPKYCGQLRRGPFLWYHGYTLQSNIAKFIEQQQTNCFVSKSIFHLDNHNGIGAHLHLWSEAMFCNIMSTSSNTTSIGLVGQYRIQTYNPNWLWLDTTYCPNHNYHAPSSSFSHISPFHCYFPKMEHRCSNDNDNNNGSTNTTMSITDLPNITYSPYARKKCPIINNNNNYFHHNMDNKSNDTKSSSSFVSEFRAGTTEYIFQSIHPIIVQEAERQIGLLFSTVTNNTNTNNTNNRHLDYETQMDMIPDEITVPDDLIVVHLRWGDKFFEMDLVSIQEYINAILYMLLFIMQRPDVTLANIYVACEDPNAIHAFLNYTNLYYPKWNIYIDRTVIELQSYRPNRGNRASWTSRNTNGRAGLMALASILICLESNYYILTTGSNYSRLINELRTNVINVHCDNCTYMIDLRPGEW
jgi:hypothetical protein